MAAAICGAAAGGAGGGACTTRSRLVISRRCRACQASSKRASSASLRKGARLACGVGVGAADAAAQANTVA
ncbi:MAG TPA: hypothetical protein VIG54_04010, partial [Lysobacter sp.]